MKCPDCDAEEHPKWKAHWFKPKVELVVEALGVVAKKVPLKKDRHRPGYQRHLMQFRRALKAGKVCVWPR